jgi:allophanate hydrolase
MKNTAPRFRLPSPLEDQIFLVVAGAHLSGMVLNREFTSLGASLKSVVRTASDYRLYALDTDPPKPGLVRDPGFNGPGIAAELWSLAPDAFARFVAALPSPMGLGKVTLSDGTSHLGFICEAHALKDAEEITAFGGWRAYMAAAAVKTKAQGSG